MTGSYPLKLSGDLLRALIVINWLYGLGIVVLLIGSVVNEPFVMGALGARPAPGNAERIAGMRQIAVVGLLGVPLAHIALSRLLSIVRTVRAGDAFSAQNGARLRTIAWVVLGMELLHIVVVAIAALASSRTAPLDIDWDFSVTRWLAVLLLFVVAQVFEEGARMREELEGTV